MKWTVVWVSAAEQELAELWMRPGTARAVSAAAHAIDKTLSQNPEEAGESRGPGQRILLEPPLGVTFEVLANDRMARVLDVWIPSQRG